MSCFLLIYTFVFCWFFFFFFSSRRRHTRWNCDWGSDVCSSDLLAPAMAEAGYTDVRHAWHPFATDASVLENMQMIYDEVRDTYAALGIITPAEIAEQQKLLAALVSRVGSLPPVWGLHQVTATV